MLPLLLLLSCTSAPPPAPPAAAPPAADPVRAQTAALDDRTPLPLTAKMAAHQRSMMREHLAAVQAITAALPAGDWATAGTAAASLGTSPGNTMMCEHLGAGAPDFTETGLAFHTTADGLVAAVKLHDQASTLRALGDTLSACTGCHARFRQEVLSEAEYTLATGAAPPTHGE